MKSRRSGTILILFGVVIALMVAVIVFNITRQASAQTKVETLDVVIAARDIPERTVVTSEQLATKRLPADAVAPGTISALPQVVGKMTTTRIYAGELILAPKLADTKGQSGLAYLLEKGKVLITFPVSDIVTTGALRVGDSVDILITYKGPSANSSQPAQAGTEMPPTTQTTMQNLKIVSLGAAATNGAGKASGNLVTFALNHDDALLLKALKDGDGIMLEAVLRAAGDEDIVKTQPVTMRTIIERYRLRSP